MFGDVTLINSRENDYCVFSEEKISGENAVSLYHRNIILSKSHILEMKNLINWVGNHDQKQIISRLRPHSRINHSPVDGYKNCCVCVNFVDPDQNHLTIHYSEFEDYIRIHNECLTSVSEDLNRVIMNNPSVFFHQQLRDKNLFG